MTAVRLIAAVFAAGLACACSPAGAGKDAPASAAPAPAAMTAASAPAQSPRAFVDDLYGQYRKDPNFSPFTHPEQWFGPELIAAFKEDERLANGEVGAVDGDPICSCQDSSGMEAQVAGVEQTSPTTAVATVNLWAGTPDQRALKVDLAVVNGQWRVHDVRGGVEGDGGFLRYVQDANKAAAAGQ